MPAGLGARLLGNAWYEKFYDGNTHHHPSPQDSMQFLVPNLRGGASQREVREAGGGSKDKCHSP